MSLLFLRRRRPAPQESEPDCQPPASEQQQQRLRRYDEPYVSPRGRLTFYTPAPPEYVPPSEPEPLPAWLASPLQWKGRSR